ncbi:hypothetical protein NQ318_004511 [Aromia moschata]|uniref:CBM39 domain-containing protein n=1 Tax=Aromia moschata TaxID=1265417 RepID=A0AAV8Y7Y1_9CUCU|nr:hypothetical protein NQ318_004511 [Aromia moschata]
MESALCIWLILFTDVALGLSLANQYIIPQPAIQVFSPKGFQVSIAHEDGVQLFAFHGNINRPMQDLEAGQFSKDILKTKGNRWVFEDHKTKLASGDVIYFWLFVIKDSLGYRYDDGEFLVKEPSLKPRAMQPIGLLYPTPILLHPLLYLGVLQKTIQINRRCAVAVISKINISRDLRSNASQSNRIWRMVSISLPHNLHLRSILLKVKNKYVTDIIPVQQEVENTISSQPPSHHLDVDFNSDKNEIWNSDPRCAFVNNLTDTVEKLRTQVDDLKEIIYILRDLAAKDDRASRTLRFEGVLPPDDDAKYTAQFIINEKLGVSVPIVDASWDENKRHITFQVASLDDKVYLIRKAKEKLQKSKISLVY